MWERGGGELRKHIQPPHLPTPGGGVGGMSLEYYPTPAPSNSGMWGWGGCGDELRLRDHHLTLRCGDLDPREGLATEVTIQTPHHPTPGWEGRVWGWKHELRVARGTDQGRARERFC